MKPNRNKGTLNNWAKMFTMVVLLSLLLVACGVGEKIKFEFKIQEKYADQFSSEDAARLLDYVKLAAEIVNEGYNTLEITTAEEALVNSDAIDYFTHVSNSPANIEVAQTMLNFKTDVVTTKLAKAKHAAAKLDKKMGIDPQYKEYLDEELVLKNKDDAREDLLALKEYVK